MVVLTALESQMIFVIIFILTLVEWLRHRDSTRFDIALMFGSLGVPIAIGLAATGLGGAIAWLTVASSIGILAQPYLTLRVVNHFRPIDRRIQSAVLVGMLVSWTLILVFPTERPTLATLVVILYFCVGNAFAGWSFLRGARRARGAARRRIQFAGTALALIALAILLAGAKATLPALADVLALPSSLITIAAALAFYVGFATPRSLRRLWQTREFHRFLSEVSDLGAARRVDATIDGLLRAGVAIIDGDAARVIISTTATQRVYGGEGNIEQTMPRTDQDEGLGAAAMKRGEAMMTVDPRELNSFERSLAGAHASRTVIAAPIMTEDRTWGVLLVTSQTTPLFPDDDFQLLLLMGTQLAYALARAQAENELATFFEVSPQPLLVTTGDGTILRANASWTRVLGYPLTEFIGRNFMEFVHPDDVASTVTEATRTATGSAYLAFRNRYRHADGSYRWIEWNGRIDSTTTLNYAVARDVTQQVELAAKMTTLNEALSAKSAELARSNADLQQFAYVASHDLKEPLRMVSSFVTLLQKKYEGQLDEKAQTYIRFAAEGATRMQQLIDGLLEYASVGANAKVEMVALDDIMEITRRSLAVPIAESKGTVESSTLPVVRGDTRQLTQVLQNLVSNALKFRKPGTPPHVRVGASDEPDRWVIHVSDDGIGIDPQYRDQLFVLFRRLNTREEYAGNGIGLAVSQRIVRQSGGELWVDSQPGQGSTFYFSIPKKEA